jgi:SAM-dependent methyltransferase
LDPTQVRDLYDAEYAAKYEQRFIHSTLGGPDAAFEVETIGRLLKPGGTWLDAACGTGYFLSKFPNVRRAGLDISPAMIERAKAANPGVEFHEADFRAPRPEFRDRWDLVSCMWYAYGLTNSIAEIELVVANLADWTSPSGTCFLPLADPSLIIGMALPYKLAQSPWEGDVLITGITWCYVEDDGRKVHSHMVAPQVELMVEMFERHFECVEFIDYPPAYPGWGFRRALASTRKRPAKA